MIYLASPYSHKDPAVMEERYLAAMDCTAWLLKQKLWVYSPIVHCHEIAKQHSLPTDFEFWKEYNKHMLGLASLLYVLAIPGWTKSIGVAGEMARAREIHLPCFELTKNGFGYGVGNKRSPPGDGL